MFRVTTGQTNFLDEIIVDNFAGGGGASTGIELACGRIVNIAINHDPAAIKMHKTNHPYTKHYCESVWEVEPEKVCEGRPVGLMWLSPDCKHFSRAKGGKPVNKNVRGLAWIAVKWARRVKPRVMILENVPEFVTWGRLDKNGRPDVKYSGETFRKFVRHLQKLGYDVKWKEIKCCDIGAPTIRKRFVLVARCDGKPIVFPEATHGEGKIPYRTAAECIDWSIPCKSIFERPKPLVENTLRRIARGLDKFTIKADKPFIVTCNHGGNGFRGQDIDKPLNTVTQKCTDGIVTPHFALMHFNNVGGAADAPLNTITTVNTHYAVMPHISKYYGGVVGCEADKPLPTVTQIDHNALVSASLIQYHTETSAKEVRGQAIDEPIMTIDASPRYGLTTANIVRYYGGADQHNSVEAPLPTVTTMERHGLIESHLCVFQNNMDCKPMDEPMPSITSVGKMAIVKTKIVKYEPGSELGYWPKIREMLNKYCGYNLADNELLLIAINGGYGFVYDIGMRMLEPRELYRAHGFPEDYIIEFDYAGNIYPRSEQVARCGNSVPPPLAEAMVRANLPEWCERKIVNMAQLHKAVAYGG